MAAAANSFIRIDSSALVTTRSVLRWSGLRPFVLGRRFRRKPDLPSILVVSVPKSGTVFTNLSLSRGLALEPASISFGYFPHYLTPSAHPPARLNQA